MCHFPSSVMVSMDEHSPCTPGLGVGFFARRDFLLPSNRKIKAPHRTNSKNGNRTASSQNHAIKNSIVSKYSPWPRTRYCWVPRRSCRGSFGGGGPFFTMNVRWQFSLEGEATIIHLDSRGGGRISLYLPWPRARYCWAPRCSCRGSFGGGVPSSQWTHDGDFLWRGKQQSAFSIFCLNIFECTVSVFLWCGGVHNEYFWDHYLETHSFFDKEQQQYTQRMDQQPIQHITPG